MTAREARGGDGAPLRLGVLVPCRNEAAVIARKLANLAALAWPAGAAHRLVVVDDGSDDGTGERAREILDELARRGLAAAASVVANRARAGKAGAIATGLEELEGAVDLVVLTDADVVLAAPALVELEQAFRGDARLGMASGAQRFVRALPGDAARVDERALEPAGGRYDRWTSAVRALESRLGRLFSVHGQLLAWRADLALRPTLGVAADDLDLMLRVRARGLAVRRVPGAVFYEVKTPPGPDRGAQALRRARAYVQALARCGEPPSRDLLDRVQWAFYRRVPTAAPQLAALLALALVAAAYLTTRWLGAAGWLGGLACALALLAAAFTAPGRDLVRLLAVIAAAVRAERRESLSDRWEMARR